MDEEQDFDTIKEDPPKEPAGNDDNLPSGIMRLRKEWVRLGLHKAEDDESERVGLEPIVFPEPVGDYRVMEEDARARLGLSEDAMDRLLSGGELDCISVRFQDGVRRMISEAALTRFISDSGLSAELADELTRPAPEVRAMLESMQNEIHEIRELHSRQLQQFKDILLLELRNLKEQDRDLTSFIYELTEGLEEVFPKLKKRKRTPPPPEDKRNSETEPSD